MRAVQIKAFGPPTEVLHLVDLPEPPRPAAGEVLVGVEYAPINLNDLSLIQGVFLVRPSLPSIVGNEGVGRIFTPLGLLADGPFPEHYEPFESPVANLLHPAQSNNPVAKKFTSDMDKLATSGGDEFNIVCTTYRLTEHYHYWTKNNPVNVQLVPEPFVEIP